MSVVLMDAESKWSLACASLDDKVGLIELKDLLVRKDMLFQKELNLRPVVVLNIVKHDPEEALVPVGDSGWILE